MSTLAERAGAFAREALAPRRLAGVQDLSEANAAAVPEILRQVGASDELVAAGHLYRLIGNTAITPEQIEREFGAPIAELVRSVVRARGTHPAGSRELAFEDAAVQTLVLAADLAALRAAHELMPRARKAVIDAIRLRAARLLHAHRSIQYEVRQALVQWQWQWQRSLRMMGIEPAGAHARSPDREP
jgi:(p)ppGpp synthase/HD superfamily hydrolase